MKQHLPAAILVLEDIHRADYATSNQLIASDESEAVAEFDPGVDRADFRRIGVLQNHPPTGHNISKACQSRPARMDYHHI
mgnify:CR=1 FL=1